MDEDVARRLREASDKEPPRGDWFNPEKAKVALEKIREGRDKLLFQTQETADDVVNQWNEFYDLVSGALHDAGVPSFDPRAK